MPYLIFLGNTATDDPEGDMMLEKLKKEASNDPDIRFMVNVNDNDRVVGALMHLSRGFIHISTKEGFGLVVSEAMWQGTPVIGSCVGGIKNQVLEGKTGYLVNPLDVETVAGKMARILEEPEEAITLGRNGKKHVQNNFLLPELVRRYLILLRFYTGQLQKLPEFRLNALSYSEIVQHLRIPNPHLPTLARLSSMFSL
jgi:trehalose synthase